MAAINFFKNNLIKNLKNVKIFKNLLKRIKNKETYFIKNYFKKMRTFKQYH